MNADADEGSGRERAIAVVRTGGAVAIATFALVLAAVFANATWRDGSHPPALAPVIAVVAVVVVVLYACTDLLTVWRGILVGSALLLLVAATPPLVMGWQRSWDECLDRLPDLPGDWRISRSFDPLDSTITCTYTPNDGTSARTDTYSLWDLV